MSDMSSEKETVVVDEGKVTFGFSRKENRGNYSNEEASAYITFTVPTVVIPGYLTEKGAEKMNDAKAIVFDSLGLDMEFDEQGRLQVVKPVAAVAAAPVTQVAPPAPFPAPAATVAPLPQAPPSAIPQTPPVAGMAQVGVYSQPPGVCGECGMNDWWDNRLEQDGKIQLNQKIGPDFKCKNQQCKHSMFRPGSFQYNKQAGPRAPQAAVAAVAQGMAPPAAPAPPPAYTNEPVYSADEAPF